MSRRGLGPGSALVWGGSSLVLIGFALWVLFAWTRYGERYARAAEEWQIGGTHLVEITLVREDRQLLACASPVSVEGLRCGFTAPNRPVAPSRALAPGDLQPYNTVKHELFLGAGLWHSPKMQGPLPAQRFTVVCNLHVVGTMKSASLRWAADGPFGPLNSPVPVGRLDNCEIPK